MVRRPAEAIPFLLTHRLISLVFVSLAGGDEINAGQRLLPAEPARLKLTIQRPPSGTYGFAITYDEANDCYRVSHLKSGSVVDNEGLIRIGDKIGTLLRTPVLSSQHRVHAAIFVLVL